MQAAAPGLRERKKAETRAALHAAAVRLFLERGPADVTVSDICEAAGVSARTFFNYFDAKEEALLPWDKHLIEEVITGTGRAPGRRAAANRGAPGDRAGPPQPHRQHRLAGL